MDLRKLLPEAIPGPAALLYSLVPGNFGRPAQRRLAALAAQALPDSARVVLDVGCGPGWLSIELGRLRPELRVLAVDLSATMVRIARFNARGTRNVEIRNENAVKLSPPDASIDWIVSAESMHHWRNPVAVLDEFHRVLRPGGRAWIFDGRDDFDEADLRGWTVAGSSRLPRPIVGLLRAILGTHGFSPQEWQSHVPELARRSRFGGGTIEPVGMYRRIELVRTQVPAPRPG